MLEWGAKYGARFDPESVYDRNTPQSLQHINRALPLSEEQKTELLVKADIAIEFANKESANFHFKTSATTAIAGAVDCEMRLLAST